jgi:hypothetical protein
MGLDRNAGGRFYLRLSQRTKLSTDSMVTAPVRSDGRNRGYGPRIQAHSTFPLLADCVAPSDARYQASPSTGNDRAGSGDWPQLTCRDAGAQHHGADAASTSLTMRWWLRSLPPTMHGRKKVRFGVWPWIFVGAAGRRCALKNAAGPGDLRHRTADNSFLHHQTACSARPGGELAVR